MSLEPMYLLTVFVVVLCAGAGWKVGGLVVDIIIANIPKKKAE